MTVAEFAGIAAAAELFGVSRYLAVPLAAVVLWYLVVAGSYRQVEKLFVAMTLVFLAYPVAAVLAHPNWSEVGRGLLVPRLRADPTFILLFVGTIGTTITPYMQLFQQSAIVEKGVARRQYGPERIDAYVGSVFSSLIAAFIIITAGATLHGAGTTEIQTAADAAQALRPVAGAASTLLFGVGLLGASLLAAGVLPLATAFAVSEALGLPKGIDLDVQRGKYFRGVFTALIGLGAGVALIPGLPLIALLIGIQVLNGVLLPISLLFLLLLINDRQLAGRLRNGGVANLLGWGTWGFVTLAVLLLFGSQVLGLFGRPPGGG